MNKIWSEVHVGTLEFGLWIGGMAVIALGAIIVKFGKDRKYHGAGMKLALIGMILTLASIFFKN